jgi:hypothetical protein
MSFYIYDGNRRYIDRAYSTKSEAEAERINLLRYFHPRNEWHQRLTVIRIGFDKEEDVEPCMIELYEPLAEE